MLNRKKILVLFFGLLAILVSLVPVELVRGEMPALASTWVSEWTTLFGKHYRTRVETYHFTHESFDPVYFEIDMWDERGNSKKHHHSVSYETEESMSLGGTGVSEAMIDLVGYEYSRTIIKSVDGDVGPGEVEWVYLVTFEKDFQYVQQVYEEKVVNGKWTEYEDTQIYWPTVKTIQQDLVAKDCEIF